MPGTILLDDLRDSVGNQLGDYVNGLTSTAQAAVAPVGSVFSTPPAAPDANAILQELQQHAQAALEASQQQAQPALQVLGGAQQAAGGAVAQLGQARDQVTQQLQQHVADVTGVGQQLQDHVNTVLGSTAPQAPAGVQSLAKPTPPPVLGTTDQNAPTLGGVSPPPTTEQAPAGGLGPIDASSPSAFARSFAPYAQYAAQKLGIDPTWVAAMAASESNYGKAGGNELFGIKALPGQPGTSMQTHEGEYGGTSMAQTFASYDTPLDAVNAFVDLLKNHYQGAVGAQDLPTFIHGLKQGGYFTAAEPEYLGIVKGITDRIGGDVQAGLQAVGAAPKPPAQVTTAQARASDLGYTDISQFGDKQLSADEAYAACGPAAAVRFAERFGRNPTLREATDLAKQVGWTASGGMAGITSEQKLLANMGVDTHIVAPDWDAIAKEASTGNPVTISTPGHYYFADGYNPQSGAFHVGRSGLDLKGGSEWMTPAQMENLMGKAQGALFADNPNVPAKGATGAALGGTAAGAPAAPITIGGPAPAKAPLYVHGPMQDAEGNDIAGATPIQSAADVVGETVGGAFSGLGTAAQQALAAAQDINRIQPGTEALKAAAPVLGGASAAVNQVAQDVQTAAQGALGAAQDINRLTPGATAVNAAAPVLGGVASDIGAGVQQTAQDLGGSGAANALLRQGRTPAEQTAFEQQQQQELGKIVQQGQQPAPPLDVGDVAHNVWNLVVNSSPGLPGVSLQDYQHASTVKNDWIAQNNPIKDVPVAGELTTQIAQQLTDPYSMVVFGLTGGVGKVPGEVAGERALAATADRLGPAGAKFVGAVADKLTSGAITGAVQNALYAAEQPDATPEQVFTALWQGAGFGAVLEPGLAASTALGRRIGQTIIDQAPRLVDAGLRAVERVSPAEDVFATTRRAGESADDYLARLATEESAGATARTGNPYDLPRSAPEPNAAPLSSEDVLSHLEQLDQQHSQNQARIADLQNQLAAGTGTPADSAELARLQADQTQLSAAHEAIWDHAGGGGDVYARPPASEGVPFQGGLDAGAAQAARGLAPENAPPTSGRSEAGPGVSGPSGAPEPTARAESAQPELAGFRLPETTTPLQDVGPQATRVTQVPTVDDLAQRLRSRTGKPGVSIEPYYAGALGDQPAFGKNVVYRDGNGQVQGVLQMLLDENGQPDSLSVAVNPARQRQGIATALYDAAKAAGYDVEKASGASGYTQEGAAFARGRGAKAPATRPETAAAPATGGVGRPRATGGEPVEGLPGVVRRTVRGVEPGAPRNISEVVSNPHLLEEARAGAPSMTDEELGAHYDQLDQRYQANQDRLAAIDEQLRNPNQKPERPPWGAGWTNDQLVTLAKRQGVSAYEPLWWEKVGLESGSGEVREDVGQSGLARGMGRAAREPTPTELRSERNQLAQDNVHIQAAADQLGNAQPGQRFARRAETTAALPFAGGEEGARHGAFATEQPGDSPGTLATDIVTRNGTKDYGSPLNGLREEPGQVVGTRGGVTGRGISDVEAARVGAPSEETLARMPNLDAMLKGDMPEVRAQIQKAAEDNPALFDAYRQGRISHESLVQDLATRVGMTREEWLKTPVGKGFNQDEMVALQAAAIDAQVRSEQMAKDIAARGGVDALSPEQVAYGLNELVDNSRLLSVARGGRSTAGRTLNALKIRLDATLARGITAGNERIVAQRTAAQARAATRRAAELLDKTRDLETEKQAVLARMRGYQNIPEERRAPVGPGTQEGMPGTPPPTTRPAPVSKSILDQIAEAYDQLDRYQAMTLHEKADDFLKLKQARDEAAAKRKAATREAPQELLSALRQELAAERTNFAKRKDTWETMAFWDSKANENVVAKRNAFRGGLYIEQYRKSAELAAKVAEANAKRAFDLESRRQEVQTKKASALLEAVGGAKPSRQLLDEYTKAVTSDDPYAPAKFIKGLQDPGWWGKAQILRIAGLLSSTVTHMVNSVGNLSQVPLELATHGLTVGIDWARAAATGGQRQAYLAELGPMLEAYGPGFVSKIPEAVNILRTGVTPVDAASLEKIRPGFASGSNVVDAAVEMPLRALQAEDELFRGGGFAMQANRVATRYAYREGFRGAQLRGRTANIVQNLESYPDLYSEAHNAMLRMVFQEHRDWIPQPRGAVARGALAQPLPFIKTPANITSQGLGLSPFGVAGTIEAVNARRALQTAGRATEAQLGRATLLAEQRLARTAIGTAIFGAGVGLGAGAFSGGKSMLTGAYDPNEASTYPQGWREWSVVTEDPVSGNTYFVPMQNFGAAGAPLAMAAIVTDAGKRGKSILDPEEMARASTAIGQYVLDNTFLQGLSDTVNVLHEPSRYGQKFLEGLAASYGPYSAMGRQIQRAYGVASRNPHDGFMGLVEAMEANYPGLSGNVPESLTPLGEPRSQGISGAAAFALPLRADILRDEPTLRALRDNDVRIPPPAKAVNVGNGWSIDLTPEEQDQLQRARGAQIIDQVSRVQDLPLYKNGDLSVRNQLLSRAVSNASQNSDVLFVRSLPDADVKSRAVRRVVPTPYTVAGEEPAA
jgi:flagellar protein FlgJ